MCERSINFAYIPMIFFLVEFGTGLTVWYLFVFHFTAKCDSIILYYSAPILLIVLVFMLSYYVSVLSELLVVMSVMISA